MNPCSVNLATLRGSSIPSKSSLTSNPFVSGPIQRIYSSFDCFGTDENQPGCKRSPGWLIHNIYIRGFQRYQCTPIEKRPKKTQSYLFPRCSNRLEMEAVHSVRVLLPSTWNLNGIDCAPFSSGHGLRCRNKTINVTLEPLNTQYIRVDHVF